MKQTVMAGARLHDWTPEHPERTAYRNHGGVDFDITVGVWPSEGAMKTTLDMQSKRAPKYNDWKPWPRKL